MKILEVDIQQDASIGLKDIKMTKLDDLVLVVGQNGSGKTRLFNKIKQLAKSMPLPQDRLVNHQQKDNMLQNIANYQKQIETWKMQGINENLARIAQYESTITSWKSTIFQFDAVLNWKGLVVNDSTSKPQLIDFVPKNLSLEGYNNHPKNQYTNHANQLNGIMGTNGASTGTLAYIKVLQDQWREVTHQTQMVSDTEKNQVIGHYQNLCDLISLMLGTELARNQNGDPLLFGLPIEQAQLSDGQKVLLQLVVALHAQNAKLSEVILMLDEPENHLHPKAIIEVIEKLRQLVSNGQIWIATHSIPLLAHFGSEYIWYMENGSIEYAGKKADKVLSSLLGGEDEQARLHGFVGLPAQLATTTYAFECLFPPRTVMTDGADPQIGQIRTSIQNLITQQNGKIKILDFGAGKGRLIANVVDCDNKQSLIENLTYVAFDPYDSDKAECISNIERIFGESSKKYFNDMNQLLSDHDEASFDVIVLCNVLHEIEHKQWKNLFKADGQITKLLKDSGYLLLVEDQHIPVGEKAYINGFLVLDTPQLKRLFSITESDTGFIYHAAKEGRLKAHLIPKNCLSRICDDNKKRAIENVKNLAKQEILRLRGGGNTGFKDGQLHGFWVQQLANADLILDE